MSYSNQNYLDQMSHFVTVIPQKYMDALLSLNGKLENKNIIWTVSGDLAERMRLVRVEVDCIEIVTSKEGAEQIFQEVQEYKPRKLGIQTRRLQRDADICKEVFPVYVRSYSFEFNINDVTVKVQGDLQFKVGNWEWGEVFDFNPEYINVTGKTIAVIPLSIQYEFYQSLGWTDRAVKIFQVIKKPSSAK